MELIKNAHALYRDNGPLSDKVLGFQVINLGTNNYMGQRFR